MLVFVFNECENELGVNYDLMRVKSELRKRFGEDTSCFILPNKRLNEESYDHILNEIFRICITRSAKNTMLSEKDW